MITKMFNFLWDSTDYRMSINNEPGERVNKPEAKRGALQNWRIWMIAAMLAMPSPQEITSEVGRIFGIQADQTTQVADSPWSSIASDPAYSGIQFGNPNVLQYEPPQQTGEELPSQQRFSIPEDQLRCMELRDNLQYMDLESFGIPVPDIKVNNIYLDENNEIQLNIFAIGNPVRQALFTDAYWLLSSNMNFVYGSDVMSTLVQYHRFYPDEFRSTVDELVEMMSPSQRQDFLDIYANMARAFLAAELKDYSLDPAVQEFLALVEDLRVQTAVEDDYQPVVPAEMYEYDPYQLGEFWDGIGAQFGLNPDFVHWLKQEQAIFLLGNQYLSPGYSGQAYLQDENPHGQPSAIIVEEGPMGGVNIRTLIHETGHLYRDYLKEGFQDDEIYQLAGQGEEAHQALMNLLVERHPGIVKGDESFYDLATSYLNSATRDPYLVSLILVRELLFEREPQNLEESMYQLLFLRLAKGQDHTMGLGRFPASQQAILTQVLEGSLYFDILDILPSSSTNGFNNELLDNVPRQAWATGDVRGHIEISPLEEFAAILAEWHYVSCGDKFPPAVASDIMDQLRLLVPPMQVSSAEFNQNPRYLIVLQGGGSLEMRIYDDAINLRRQGNDGTVEMDLMVERMIAA